MAEVDSLNNEWKDLTRDFNEMFARLDSFIENGQTDSHINRLSKEMINDINNLRNHINTFNDAMDENIASMAITETFDIGLNTRILVKGKKGSKDNRIKEHF
jgi:hypothetical protein